MSKLKICFTSNSSPWSKFHGGGQIFIHNLARQLNRRGHKVTVIYSGPVPDVIFKDSNHDYQKEWVPYFGYPYTAKFRQFNSFSFYRKLKSLHSNCKFDIVNALGGEAALIPKFCDKSKIPHVISIEHPNLRSISPEINWKSPLNTVLSILRTRELLIAKYVSKNAKAVITPSKFTKQETVKFFKINSRKIHVVYHGIIDDMLNSEIKNNDRDKNGPIIFFGRLEPQKGLDSLIKAFFILVNKDSMDSRELIVIGDGPCKREYQEMVKEFGIENSVKFKGWRTAAYINDKLAGASLCVLPSTSESFGLSMAETLSQGVPLVTTAAGSIPEVVDQQKGAWLAKPDNPENLSQIIFKSLANYAESLRKAHYGKNFVLRNFSWSNAAEEYEQIYLSAINDTK